MAPGIDDTQQDFYQKNIRIVDDILLANPPIKNPTKRAQKRAKIIVIIKPAKPDDRPKWYRLITFLN